jgi:hypothetical protein
MMDQMLKAQKTSSDGAEKEHMANDESPRWQLQRRLKELMLAVGHMTPGPQALERRLHQSESGMAFCKNVISM